MLRIKSVMRRVWIVWPARSKGDSNTVTRVEWASQHVVHPVPVKTSFQKKESQR
jgi:hypothetical protein